MDKQMTALQRLEERFQKYVSWQEGHHKATPYTLNELINDFHQAKQMEREQMVKAYNKGELDTINLFSQTAHGHNDEYESE